VPSLGMIGGVDGWIDSFFPHGRTLAVSHTSTNGQGGIKSTGRSDLFVADWTAMIGATFGEMTRSAISCSTFWRRPACLPGPGSSRDLTEFGRCSAASAGRSPIVPATLPGRSGAGSNRAT